MNIGFDPLALIVALCAIALAIYEIRRNNSVVVRITKCQTAYHETIEEGFYGFELTIRNHGISLHSPTVTLGFRGPSQLGWCYLRLQSQNDCADHREFARGMYATFTLESHRIDEGFKEALRQLVDATAQDACFFVYTQRYLAKVIRIGGVHDFVAERWNKIAFRINRLFRREIKEKDAEGLAILKCPEVLPILPSRRIQIKTFIDWSTRTVPRNDRECNDA